MCGGSPLIWLSSIDVIHSFTVQDVGEITQGRENYNTRSPLSEPDFFFVC